MIFKRVGKALLGAAATAPLLLGAITLSAPPAQAGPVILLCGPTYLWVCSGIGGPEILFPGTLCEKRIFERKTGFHCKPYYQG